MKKKLPLLLFTCILLSISVRNFAQTMQDGFMMPKKQLCLVAQYGKESWSEYWEGDRLRNNQNIGTLTTTNAVLMANYGVTDKLNVIASLPYIETSASAGTATGLKGIQDLTVAAKYNFFNFYKLQLFGVVGGSIPVTNYVPDFLPFSIGLQSKTAAVRLIAHQILPLGIHVTAQAGYIARDKITVDRTNYYTGDQISYSNEMAVPDQVSTSLRVGINKKAILAEAFVDNVTATSGTDIRRYDMPLPTNKMDWTRIGLFVTWHTPLKNFSINAHGSQIVAGRNVGKVSSCYGFQLQYILDFNRTK